MILADNIEVGIGVELWSWIHWKGGNAEGRKGGKKKWKRSEKGKVEKEEKEKLEKVRIPKNDKLLLWAMLYTA